MSKLRRGLLAAGLATAVVGGTGVVWTLNASAAVAPGTTASIVDAAPVADRVPAMPKLLPWGAKPSPLKRAKPGANSKAVAAAGADIAASDTSGSVLPVAEFAPKGLLAGTGATRRVSTAAAPAAPGTPEAAAADDDTNYYYAGARQEAETDGSWANLHIEKPELGSEDEHTLVEIAVQSADRKQAVEVGWTVDRKVNGDDDPHLFVFHWKDGAGTCYNACGFVQTHKTVKPGDTLPLEGQKRFGIQHFDGVWWVAYNSEYIGYFPDKLWNGGYTRAGLVQWFGEVASPSTAPCADMGNGISGLKLEASRIGTISQKNGPEVKYELVTPNPNLYQASRGGDRTFYLGGPGSGDC